jgi:hypothetical protein
VCAGGKELSRGYGREGLVGSECDVTGFSEGKQRG